MTVTKSGVQGPQGSQGSQGNQGSQGASGGGGGGTSWGTTISPRGGGLDDHSIVQAALDAGGRVAVTSGDYYFTKPLEWVNSSTYLDCDNTRATIFHCHPSWDSTGTNPDRQLIRNWREADWTIAETNYRIVPIKCVTFPVVGGQNVYPRIRGTLQLKPDGKPNVALFSWCGPNETSNIENLILSGGYDFVSPNTDHNLGTWGIDLQGAQNGATFGQVTFYGNGWARQISIDGASVPGHAVGGGNVWFKGPVTFSPARNYEAVIYVQDVFDVEFESAHFESCNDAGSLATIYLNSCFGFQLNGGSFDMNSLTDANEANHKPFIVQTHLGSQGAIERPPCVRDFYVRSNGSNRLFDVGVPFIQDLWNTIPHQGALGPNITIAGNGIGKVYEYDGMKIAFADQAQDIYEHYFKLPDMPGLTEGVATGAVADFSTDNSTVIQTALNSASTIVVTLSGGNSSAFGLAHPIVIPNGVRLRMQGTHGTGSQLKALSTFPHTTVSGTQTTPASSATTFTLNVGATANFPGATGGITVQGGIGVLTLYGITIYYSGTTSTSFTGCQTYDTSVTIPDAAYVSVPMVWLGWPGLSSGQDFGSRLESASIHCNSIAGAGIYSGHVQECGGWYDVHVLSAMVFGIRVDAVPQVSGMTPVNWAASKMNIEVAPTADSQACGIDIYNLRSPMWDGRIKLDDISIVSGGGVTVVGNAAMRLNGFSGRVTDVHMERFHDGILVGDKAASNATIEDISAGSSGFSAAGKAFVHIGSASGQVLAIRQVYKALTGDTRSLLQDDGAGFTMDVSETDLAQYTVNNNGARNSTSPSLPPGPGSVSADLVNNHLQLNVGGLLYYIGSTGLLTPKITRVKTLAAAAGTTGVVTSMTLTVGSAVPAGHHVILGTSFGFAGATTITATDTRSNTYQSDVVRGTSSGSAPGCGILSSRITTPLQAGDTITITYSIGVGNPSAAAYEYGNLATSSWFDAGDGTTGSSSTAASPSVTTTGSQDLLFGVVTTVNQAITTHAGFALLNTKVNSTKTVNTFDEIVFASGSYTLSAGIDLSSAWAAAIATYKSA